MELFKDIIPALLQTKKRVITSENEKEYVPFIINRSLSLHADCIFVANQLNIMYDVDHLLQNDYGLNTIRAWKRPFQKWQKLESNDNLELVKEYYGYSAEKAKDALKLLTDTQIDAIKKRLDKGGIYDKRQQGRHI